jgi:hypothetical protein
MNHYEWLDENFPDFCSKLNINFETRCAGIITAHGDKCYGYESIWKKIIYHLNMGSLFILLPILILGIMKVDNILKMILYLFKNGL